MSQPPDFLEPNGQPTGRDYLVAELAEPASPPDAAAPAPGRRGRIRRRTKLPVILFLITCVSTGWAGTAGWLPGDYLVNCLLRWDAMPIRRAILTHWHDGLIYMACVLGILLTHEMGHFLATLRYHIPASFPFFLPLPISPIGTMGAVIGMDGRRADRKQTFDIGLAGPLAGLLVALPILWIGVQKLDMRVPAHGPFTLEAPLAVRLMLAYAPPPGYTSGHEVWYSHLNPYFMAGWVGLLVTGLNMLPVSQLDGGHVLYTLFGRRAHWVARAFMLVALAYIFWKQAWMWTLMILVILLIGTAHPPTRDDTVPLGWLRIILGLISLLIPLFCFAPGALRAID